MNTIIKAFQKEDQVSYKLVLIQGLNSVSISNPPELLKKINSISSKFKIVIQVCNAQRIATWEHIFFGVLYAMLAFHQKRNILNQLALEILLYISGQRQIKLALEEFGMKSGNNVVIILGNSEETVKQALKECERVLGGDKSDEVMTFPDNSKRSAIKDYFQINELELNAVKMSESRELTNDAILKIVLNRIALVALEK